jgi:hypothetical protein
VEGRLVGEALVEGVETNRSSSLTKAYSMLNPLRELPDLKISRQLGIIDFRQGKCGFSAISIYTEFTKQHFLILSCTPFRPQNSLDLSGPYKVLKASHRDSGPC